MKVMPIFNHQKNVQAFKGLWGEDKHERYMLDSSYYIYENRTVKSYHPFLDESKADIAKVVSRTEFFKGGMEDLTDAESCRVEVKEPLNFTKAEWNQYSAGKLKHRLDVTKRLTAELIENSLKQSNLDMHIK